MHSLSYFHILYFGKKCPFDGLRILKIVLCKYCIIYIPQKNARHVLSCWVVRSKNAQNYNNDKLKNRKSRLPIFIVNSSCCHLQLLANYKNIAIISFARTGTGPLYSACHHFPLTTKGFSSHSAKIHVAIQHMSEHFR